MVSHSPDQLGSGIVPQVLRMLHRGINLGIKVFPETLSSLSRLAAPLVSGLDSDEMHGAILLYIYHNNAGSILLNPELRVSNLAWVV